MRITICEKNDIIEKYRSGWTNAEIAKSYPYSEERIRQIIKETVGEIEVAKRRAVKKIKNAIKNNRAIKIDKDILELGEDGFKYFSK